MGEATVVFMPGDRSANAIVFTLGTRSGRRPLGMNIS